MKEGVEVGDGEVDVVVYREMVRILNGRGGVVRIFREVGWSVFLDDVYCKSIW